MKFQKNLIFWLGLIFIPAGLLSIVSIYSIASDTATLTRVSVAFDGRESNGLSWHPHISADGRYIAFASNATNLVLSDTNEIFDIFIYDWQSKQTTRVSIASDGTQGDENSWLPFVSADGRYVVFQSGATNLVSDDMNGEPDIFVHDRETSQTTLVSIASDGTQSNDLSSEPSISADGRYIIFASYANNLVPGDTNICLTHCPDVFVHDRLTGQTTRVSVASDGTQGNRSSGSPSISADGRYIAFWSYATNLVDDDTNNFPDIFVHDRQSAQTTRVSVASDGTQSNDSSGAPSISADGRYIAFSSKANNLVGNDFNDSYDIFVHDRQNSQTIRVSIASDGTEGNQGAYFPAISADGRYIAFESRATNLVSDDINGVSDIFLHDRQTGQTRRISVATDGTEANSNSDWPSISADGQRVAFESAANDLIYDDMNLATDVFVYEQVNTPTMTATPSITFTPVPTATSVLPSIAVQQDASVSIAEVGQMVSYTYRVTNTGNIRLR